MKKTKTSSFGTGKRESHDASRFYQRSIYEGGPRSVPSGAPEGETPVSSRLLEKAFADPMTFREMSRTEVPEPGDWADTLYCQSSTNMDSIPDNSIAVAFTSPPYNVGKEYDEDISLREYLRLIEEVGREVYRVLRPGGRYVINVTNLGRKPYIPLHGMFYMVHWDVGFLSMGEIIWQKAKGASGSCAWGSWQSAKSPRLRDIHEYLLVFAKKGFGRPDKGESDIGRDEFMEATLSIWQIPPESAKRVKHPAPFPVELAARVIRLYSYVGDVVLDPFLGSGTTCVAAVKNRRHYVGFDTVEEYCNISESRIIHAKSRFDYEPPPG